LDALEEKSSPAVTEELSGGESTPITVNEELDNNKASWAKYDKITEAAIARHEASKCERVLPIVLHEGDWVEMGPYPDDRISPELAVQLIPERYVLHHMYKAPVYQDYRLPMTRLFVNIQEPNDDNPGFWNPYGAHRCPCCGFWYSHICSVCGYRYSQV
jgi:hypothetical protein